MHNQTCLSIYFDFDYLFYLKYSDRLAEQLDSGSAVWVLIMTRRREHIIFLSPYIGCLSVSIDFKIILLALKELYGLVPELFFPSIQTSSGLLAQVC